MTKWELVTLCTIVFIFIVTFGIGLGLSEYYDHVENMAKLEAGCDD